MSYDEISTGGAQLCGNAIVTRNSFITTSYAASDIVYNIHKAKKGVLEKIVIKKVLFVGDTYESFIYKDTFNALWNEGDLTDLNSAKILAQIFFERKLTLLGDLQSC